MGLDSITCSPVFLSSYQASITRLASITRSHAPSVSSHVLWHKHTRRKKDRKEERNWGLMNRLYSVFPTCRTADSSRLKPLCKQDSNTHSLIISSKNKNNSLWWCLTSFDSSNSLQWSWARSHASLLRLQTQLNNQGFNCYIIPQSIKLRICWLFGWN